MQTKILTLCELCAAEYAHIYRLKPYPGSATTDKKTYCEACRMKRRPVDLKQYLLSGKRGGA